MQFSLKLIQFLPRSIFFWLPLLIIFLGYGFLGRYMRILYIDSISLNSSLAVLTLAIASVWAVPLALGGIVATILSLALTFRIAGINTGLIATVVAAIVIWVGFKDTDIEKDTEKDLAWQDWLATLVTLVWAVVTTLAISKSLSGGIASVFLGANAGAIAAIGLQFKSASLTQAQNFQFLGTVATLGILIGLAHGIFTYIVVTPG